MPINYTYGRTYAAALARSYLRAGREMKADGDVRGSKDARIFARKVIREAAPKSPAMVSQPVQQQQAKAGKIHFAVTMQSERYCEALDVFAETKADAIAQARRHFNRTYGLTRYVGCPRTFKARHAINCGCCTCSGRSL